MLCIMGIALKNRLRSKCAWRMKKGPLVRVQEVQMVELTEDVRTRNVLGLLAGGLPMKRDDDLLRQLM
jgi:hypothetical protein